MPQMRLRRPTDAMVVAASLSAMHIRTEVDLDELRSQLSGWTPRAVLDALAEVLHHVREAGVDPDEHRRFLPNFSYEARPFAERWLDESDGNPRQVLLAEQFIAIAGLIALEQSDPAGRDDRGSLVSPLIVGSTAVPDILGVDEVLLDISRLSLFAPSQDWGDQLTVARRILRLLCADHRKIDYDAACRATFSVGLEEAWMMTAVFAVIGQRYGRTKCLYPWRFNGEPGGLGDDVLATGRQLWAQSLTEAVDRATEDCKNLGWSFRAFVERPITDNDGEQIVVWPRAFEERAYPFGLFALAQRVATKQGKSMDTVRQDCADVLEELVQEQLDECYPHLVEIISEADQRKIFTGERFRSKQSDWLLVEDKFVVALEARHRPYSFKAQAIGDLSDLQNDIEISIVNKLEQCDAALDNSHRSGLLAGRTAIAVIVNSCPVPVSPVLIDHVEEQLGKKNITPFRSAHPYRIAVVNAVHLHQILRGSRRTGRSAGGIIQRWRAHPQLGDMAFYDWATQHCPRATRNIEVDWFSDAVRTVLGFDLEPE